MRRLILDERNGIAVRDGDIEQCITNFILQGGDAELTVANDIVITAFQCAIIDGRIPFDGILIGGISMTESGEYTKESPYGGERTLAYLSKLLGW